MSSGFDADSVTDWLLRLSPAGNQEAAQRLWERYYQQLVVLARKKLGTANRRVCDEEDVVVMAFDSFCRGAVAGRYPNLKDRDDLWRLLMAITGNKARDQLRHQHAAKRGGGAVRGHSVFGALDDSQSADGLDQVMANEPTPEVAGLVAEEFGRLLNGLGDDMLRKIALLRLENYTVVEIANQLDCSLRTVKRRLASIRQKWEKGVS
jgi:RNA polymerase sigma factor (sigma-70 family)